jgi:hypothetical protein
LTQPALPEADGEQPQQQQQAHLCGKPDAPVPWRRKIDAWPVP